MTVSNSDGAKKTHIFHLIFGLGENGLKEFIRFSYITCCYKFKFELAIIYKISEALHLPLEAT